MSLGLYMDQHVKSAVTRGLRMRGIDVLTIQEDGRSTAEDNEVLCRATELQRVVFTQDDDFLVIAADRQHRSEEFSGVVFAAQQRVTTSQCINELELIAKILAPAEAANQVFFLPLQ